MDLFQDQRALNQYWGYDQGRYKSNNGDEVKIFRSQIPNEWQPCGEGDNVCTCTRVDQCGYVKMQRGLIATAETIHTVNGSITINENKDTESINGTENIM